MNKHKDGDIIEGQIDFLNNGNASIKLEDKEIFIYKKNTLNAFHLDKVKVKLIQRGKNLEGSVVEVIERLKNEWVGRVHINKKTTFVVLDNPKISVDFWVKNRPDDLKDGQKVVVKLLEWDGTKSPVGEITRVLGNSGDNNVEMNSIMIEYGLPIEFPKEVEMESEKINEEITEEEIKKRKDLRGIPTIGIDPYDSKDADDTLSLEVVDGLYYVYVNIADVSHYVKLGSELDKEAYRRGFSVYLVDRVIPMLPHRLSNGVCSLKSGSDKLAFTVLFKMDKNANILDVSFFKSVIHVDKDYAYEEAQEVIENGVREETKTLDNVILVLDGLAKQLRKRRIKDSLEINTKEVKFHLDENGKPTGVFFKEQKDSNKLIEEFMLLSNQNVAKFIKSKGLPCVSRIHDNPDDEKLVEIKRVAENFGHEIDITDDDKIKENLNKLVRDAKDKPEENLINTLIIRSQKKAGYSTIKHKHYGIGFDDYSHFTSAIRRYPDFLTHILLEMALTGKKLS